MLPTKYKFLDQEGAPKMLVEALKLYGTEEIRGTENNPVILEWAKEINENGFVADSIPWCGLFVGVVAKRAGKELPINPLWALNWIKFGTKVDQAMLGDVLIFHRHGGGHVGIYVGEDSNCYHVLGGNQGDKVSIVRIEKFRLAGIRKPIYSIGQPPNVRQIFFKQSGEISKNES